MGIPTITYKSDYRQGRGYTLLEQVGMGDLAAGSDEEFAQKACDLANDVERIRHIKKTLPQSLKDSPLFNERVFRQAFENTVRQAHVRYCHEHKRPFNASIYDGDPGALFLDCMRAADTIAYLAEEEPLEMIKQLVSEYFEMAKLYLMALIDAYQDEPGALTLIQRVIDTLPALGLADDGKAAASHIAAINKIFMQLTV
jgi:hypothetical protein